MKTRIAYWTCQAAGWGFYTVMGISMAAQQVGWRFSLIASFILFCLYSIALTDLLRREIRRRQWLNSLTFFTFLRLFGAALILAAIQTFLIVAIDIAFNQRTAFFFSNPSYIRL